MAKDTGDIGANMNGKEFTQHDMTIAEQLSSINTSLTHILSTQDMIINRLDSSLEKNDTEHNTMLGGIRDNKTKIHWMVGIGCGVMASAGIIMGLIRIYG